MYFRSGIPETFVYSAALKQICTLWVGPTLQENDKFFSPRRR
jgi:hypothetical protein